ncbi:MAG: hypothetical protein EBR82_10020 [Caulobacteraceae bacterium]|nr:hypothetical protein [Caulobacteraceae bacterium]
MSGSKFGRDMSDWVKRAKQKSERFYRAFCQDLNNEIITTTPIDTGFARNHWFTSINTPVAFNLEKGQRANPEAQTAQTVANLKVGDKFISGNNVAYILPLEYGHSQQAPNGMVRIAIAKADQIAQATLMRINANGNA